MMPPRRRRRLSWWCKGFILRKRNRVGGLIESWGQGQRSVDDNRAEALRMPVLLLDFKSSVGLKRSEVGSTPTRFRHVFIPQPLWAASDQLRFLGMIPPPVNSSRLFYRASIYLQSGICLDRASQRSSTISTLFRPCDPKRCGHPE